MKQLICDVYTLAGYYEGDGIESPIQQTMPPVRTLPRAFRAFSAPLQHFSNLPIFEPYKT